MNAHTIDKSKLLLQEIENLKSKETDYKEVSSLLFEFNYDDFKNAFQINANNVPENTYIRVPVFSGSCCAILMLWGANNKTAIHDHLNYDGKIKVLKGSLTEKSYVEDGNFIKYEGEGIAEEGVIFDEELGGIHSVINNSSDLAVSLHIYHTSQTSLKGVKIFDIENRKTAWLNEKATSCSWNLPADSFDKIIEVQAQA